MKTPLIKDSFNKVKIFSDITWFECGSGDRNVFLPADTDCKQLTLAPEDLQYIERTKLNRGEIASIFNVPARTINDLERATFSNISSSRCSSCHT